MHNLLPKLWAEGSVRCARYGCAALVALGVLAIFFCPLAGGSFQATHGPVTALRASRSAVRVFQTIAYFAFLLPVILTSLLLGLFPAFLAFERGSDSLGHAGDPVCVPCALRC